MNTSPNGWWETEFIELMESRFPDRHIKIHRDIDGNPFDVSLLDSQTILILFADELLRQKLTSYQSAHYIFAQYHETDKKNSVYNIPLGIFNVDKVDSDTVKLTRRYKLAFSGCLNSQRVHLAAVLLRYPVRLVISLLKMQTRLSLMYINMTLRSLYPQCFFMFTNRFSAGLSKAAYTKLLLSSESVLCPPGFTNHESFRISEALYSGCSPIIPSKLTREYHENLIKLDFSTVTRSQLLSLMSLQSDVIENRNHYERWFAPSIVAGRLFDQTK